MILSQLIQNSTVRQSIDVVKVNVATKFEKIQINIKQLGSKKSGASNVTKYIQTVCSRFTNMVYTLLSPYI